VSTKRGSRAIGPPPGTNPAPTSHCDRVAFSRLAKRMSLASAGSLPTPVARGRGDRHDERPGETHQQAGRTGRQSERVLRLCEKIVLGQEQAFTSLSKTTTFTSLSLSSAATIALGSGMVAGPKMFRGE
jgi:hypothetical protein